MSTMISFEDEEKVVDQVGPDEFWGSSPGSAFVPHHNNLDNTSTPTVSPVPAPRTPMPTIQLNVPSTEQPTSTPQMEPPSSIEPDIPQKSNLRPNSTQQSDLFADHDSGQVHRAAIITIAVIFGLIALLIFRLVCRCARKPEDTRRRRQKNRNIQEKGALTKVSSDTPTVASSLAQWSSLHELSLHDSSSSTTFHGSSSLCMMALEDVLIDNDEESLHEDSISIPQDTFVSQELRRKQGPTEQFQDEFIVWTKPNQSRNDCPQTHRFHNSFQAATSEEAFYIAELTTPKELNRRALNEMFEEQTLFNEGDDHPYISLGCGHEFHPAFILDWIGSAYACPFCPEPVFVRQSLTVLEETIRESSLCFVTRTLKLVRWKMGAQEVLKLVWRLEKNELQGGDMVQNELLHRVHWELTREEMQDLQRRLRVQNDLDQPLGFRLYSTSHRETSFR